MQLFKTDTTDLPPRDFPLLLRAEWRTTHPRFGRLRALESVTAVTARTPRPIPLHERVRARQRQAIAAE